MSSAGGRLDFETLGRVCLTEARELLLEWLPSGRLIGKEFTCGSLQGEEGSSLKVNISSGLWSDFSTGDKGGDLISLLAAIRGVSQGDAAQEIKQRLQINGFTPKPPRRKPTAATPTETDEPSLAPPPAGTPSPSLNHPSLGKPQASWCYSDAGGATLFYVARYQSDPATRKQYVPWSWDTLTASWVTKAWPAPRPLYNLADLVIHPDKPVLIVEGEKCVHAAAQLTTAYVVVTWPSGAMAWGKADWSSVYGRKILIWPDSDQPGIAATRGIASVLHPHCPEIKILDVESTPEDEGFDAADALGRGWEKGDFNSWAKSRVTLYVPPATPEVIDDSHSPPFGDDVIEVKVKKKTPLTHDQIELVTGVGLTCTASGQPVPNVDNAIKIIHHLPELSGHIWYDTFHTKYFTDWGPEGLRQWDEVDDIELAVLVQSRAGIHKFTDAEAARAVKLYGRRNKRDEPKDWVMSLEWDKTSRVEEFFIRAMGAKDCIYTRHLSQNWWVALVARIMTPGVKVDNMVVLEGEQGIGKSTAWSTIGGKWHAVNSAKVGSKDFLQNMPGKLILEIAELDSFNKAEITTIKGVLSDPEDHYRQSYGHYSKTFKRRSVFVGTTNEDEYLRDASGGRRFWPLMTHVIDLQYIRDNREQFFAEAYALYQQGISWWVMPKEDTIAEQEARRQADEWEPVVAHYIEELPQWSKDQLTILSIATEALKVDLERVDAQFQKRVGKILRILGYKSGTKRVHGKSSRVWTKKDL